MLAGEILGARVSPRLAALLHEHTQGNPFFIEELAAALVDGDRLIRRRDGLGLGPGGALPVPESVRDAVPIRVARLSPEARAALEVSAVAGTVVDLDLVAELGEVTLGLCSSRPVSREMPAIGDLTPGRDGFGELPDELCTLPDLLDESESPALVEPVRPYLDRPPGSGERVAVRVGGGSLRRGAGERRTGTMKLTCRQPVLSHEERRRPAYQEAYTYCEARGADGAAQVCLVCLAFILVHTGQWDRALELDRAILASPDSPVGVQMGAKQHFGLIHAARGHSRQARKLLAESGSYAERHERQRMEVWDALGQAWVDELEGDLEAAANRCRAMLARWHDSESLHYPVPALRWATSFLAQSSFEADARARAASLARLAAATVNPEAAAALAHALGETSLLDGDAAQASTHFDQALDLLRELELPYEAAQTRLRAGVAHGVAGSQETAVERLTGAYRTFRKLGAQPAADRAARELARLGEQVDRRLGRRAAARLEGPGLTSRELEIVRLVASGQTNREIARDLFLSTRTVDMHVRNVLRKLDCRSRAEATRKAGTLNLLQ